MAAVGNMNIIPLFVKAKKPEQLIVQMHTNNVKHGIQFNYQITHDGKNWFAWYNADLIEQVKKQRNGLK